MPSRRDRRISLSRPTYRWAHGGVSFRVMLSLGLVDDPSGDLAKWDEAEWGTGTWQMGGPGQAYWFDVTAYSLGVETSRGRDRFEGPFRTGSFRLLLDNTSGLWNPISGETPHYALTLRPGRWFRLEANTGGGWFPVFTGYVDAISDEYRAAGHDIVTAVSGYGFGGVFTMDRVPPLETPIPAGQRTDERISYLLDRWGWPAAQRNLQTGIATMLASNLPGSTLTEMQNAATAEGGGFFFDGSAVPTFKARDWLTTDPRSTSVQYRIGGPGSDIDPIQYEVDWSAQRIYNDVQLQRRDGTMQRATDTASWSRYFRRTLVRTNLENESDTAVLELADRFLAAFAYDRIRIESVEVYPSDNARAITALGTEIGDLVEATVSTGAGWGYTAEAHVMRISHSLTADDWRVSLRLDDALTTPPPELGSFDGGFSAGFRIGG